MMISLALRESLVEVNHTTTYFLPSYFSLCPRLGNPLLRVPITRPSCSVCRRQPTPMRREPVSRAATLHALEISVRDVGFSQDPSGASIEDQTPDPNPNITAKADILLVANFGTALYHQFAFFSNVIVNLYRGCFSPNPILMPIFFRWVH